MARIARNLAELIGGTPLLRLARLAAGFDGELLAKLEFLNPSGSDRDREVRAILDAAEAEGTLQSDTVIIEPTSGNIAFSLATLAVPRGYRLILVMPDAVAATRVQLLRALGAEVVLTPGAEGMAGADARADELARDYPSVFRPEQFRNAAALAAQEATADEIWESCEGEVAALVVGVSTGSAITGIGGRLKALSGGKVQVVAVEPAASPILTEGRAGRHRLYGMGPAFTPPNYDPSIVDEVIGISNVVCQETLLHLYRSEGVMSGPTGGAALAAALRLTQRPAFAGTRIVALIPDSMERYLELPFWPQYRLVTPIMPEEV